MAYADGDDMVARYDFRTLGDLVDDYGVRVAKGNLATHANMMAALEGAAGEINSSCLRAGRYTVADLQALTGDDLAFLKDINCAIGYWRLWKRRSYSDDKQRQEAREAYLDSLKLLRSGETIFNDEDVINAGKPDVDTVTRVDITTNWNLVVDRMRGRFLPRRRSYRNR